MNSVEADDQRPISEGVMHGPYPAAPEELVAHYLSNRDIIGFDPSCSDEQLAADIQSEYQYDQHCDAVMEALQAKRINEIAASKLIDIVLRPWWIGHRNPGE